MTVKECKEYEKALSMELSRDEEEVHQIYCMLREREGNENKLSLQSMRNTIGSKNNEFTDCIHREYATAEDFLAEWIKGLVDQQGAKIQYGSDGEPVHYILIEMMHYPIAKNYILNFIKRNFYRNYHERTRFKPLANLWEVWFGSNPLYWGILICPVKRGGSWTNDVSEIRRTSYEYWTVGHVMSTGIVALDSLYPYTFPTLNSFIAFYDHIIKRLSKSVYEQEIMSRYFEYLSKNSNYREVPLLIPEFRYYGDEVDHKYRLDFTILNPYTQRYVAFELSPQSTHMNISGIKKEGKTQKEINDELKIQWQKEMDKRNKYFSQYGITVITFTDAHLQDIDKCFNTIKIYLEERAIPKANYSEQIGRIENIFNN